MTVDAETTLLRARVATLEQLLQVYETEVANQSDRLEHALSELETQNARLERTARDLEAVNEELEHFAFIASHDLKEPLRTITSFVTLLDEHCQGALDAQAREFMGFIIGGAARMRALIDDLLAYSRLEKQPALTACDAGAALAEALGNLDAAIRECGGTISAPALPVVVAEPRMLTLLFQNLIANALKFRRAEAPKIGISVADAGDVWRISVQDNGIGIKEQHLGRIFVIFKRLHSAEKYAGTGLGLAICKKIAESAGGRIWVESTVGEGSTFHVELRKSLASVAREPELTRTFNDLTRSLDQVKEALNVTEQRFQAFMSHGPFVATIKDSAGTYLYANEPFEKRLGLKASAVRGKQDEELWPAAVATLLRAGDRRTLSAAGPTESFERLPTPQGDRDFLHFRFPFNDTRGRIVIGALAIDVTGWTILKGDP